MLLRDEKAKKCNQWFKTKLQNIFVNKPKSSTNLANPIIFFKGQLGRKLNLTNERDGKPVRILRVLECHLHP